MHPEDIPRFAGLNATANIQPLWATHEPQRDELTIPFLGERRAGWQYPFRSLHAAGAALCAGSDWPVSSPDPRPPTRQGPPPPETMIMASFRCYLPQTGHDHERGPSAHCGHRPNSSTVCPTSVNPASAATFSAHCSTARPSTSTLRPQLRQVRWWWCTLVSHCR